MPGPAVWKGTQERSSWKREKGARIVNLFRVGIVSPFGCAGGTTESGLKLIQDCELVIKLAVYVCITGKAIKIIKRMKISQHNSKILVKPHSLQNATVEIQQHVPCPQSARLTKSCIELL